MINPTDSNIVVLCLTKHQVELLGDAVELALNEAIKDDGIPKTLHDAMKVDKYKELMKELEVF